ncbi:Tyrosine-protein kinase YwqD [Nocardioides dokdonensis FR1436]|uniref:non-specific protein-tyrosine kinase n=1 Tax=Nocardioides dokdonensis FR1436 TaxID=1300347 RepID=A0A1A9GJG3_9ACTN|nr:polysaccharide biosynthesis tyrosine autokinase [Nocardioides dokdonensis]ANH38206.1 Tyrosine-protein kinase YwqD [Nocardioides dokdonensis FR1436]
MELKDYLRILRRRWLMVVASTLIVVGAASAFTFTATPQYQSTARLFVSTYGDGGSGSGDVSSAYQGGLFSQQRVSSYAVLVGKSESLAQSVVEDLDLSLSASELRSKVSATVSPETVLIELSALDADPVQAQAIAQAYAMGLSDLVRKLETPAGADDPLIKASVEDDASLPSSPVTPQPVRNLGLAFVLGLLLGFGLAVARELLDTSVKTVEDVSTTTEAPLLGSIAYDASVKTEPLVSTLDSHAPRAEAFRVLRTNLQFVDVDAATKVFVVTSALPGEGKTTTAVNLALTLAQAGQKTLLIECDLRRPKATAALDLDSSVGVTTVLLGKVSFEDALQEYAATGLAVLASGAIPPNPAELLQSRAMTELLTRCREQFDTIIIDAPPLLPVTDAALLSTQADGAILVVAHGRTTKDQLAQAAQRLGAVDAALVGAVLNMTPSRRGRGYGASYGYGYGYGYAPSAPEPTKPHRSDRSRRRGSDKAAD